MVGIVRIALILFSFLACNVEARNGCRQCYGYFYRYFDDYVSEDQAVDYLWRKLYTCATGNDFKVTNMIREDCQGSLCRKWNISINAYRYCGNGHSVDYGGMFTCVDGKCFNALVLHLTCLKSVQCFGTCFCSQCGC